MTQENIKLLELVKNNPDKYQIVIDNDCIWVDDISTMKYVGDFSSYGYEFAHDLLKHLGYNVDYC